MKIYIAHSRGFDFKKELYDPIINSPLSKKHIFIFPHSDGNQPFSSKDLFKNGCDLVIAETSFPSTGLGIELGWADILNIPVACIYKKGVEVSNSLRSVTNTFLEYSNPEELLLRIENIIENG